MGEELFLQHMDLTVLEEVAGEIQALVEEEAEAERADPRILLTEGWTRVFKSVRYKNVLAMGAPAMKPLCWIVYKSSGNGLYEYICACALCELSGYGFTREDGSRTWSTAKKFIERFDEKVLEDRG